MFSESAEPYDDTPNGLRRASEVHELGLFTRDEMATAFEEAGLRAEFDTVGLTRRGLGVARSDLDENL